MSDHHVTLPGLGYEQPRSSTMGTVVAWVVFVFMVAGATAAVGLEAGWLLTAAEGLSFLLVLPTYVILLKRIGPEREDRSGRRISGIGWTNIGLLVLLPVLMTAYGASNAALFGTHSVRGHWDQYVPTIPAFIVPYLFTYVWVVSTMAYLATRLLNRQMRTALTAGLLSVSVAIVTFLLFQTDVDTIGLSESSYADFLGSAMQYMDEHMFAIPDYGDFPSVHVAWSVTLAIAWVRRDRLAWSTGAVILAALIIIATQVLHQHSLMAALYGIIVAAAMFSLSWLVLEFRPAIRRYREAGVTRVS